MLACVEDDLKAASTFYGSNPRPLSAVAEACPIVGSYGSKDPFTRRAATDRLKSRSRFSLAAMKSMMSG